MDYQELFLAGNLGIRIHDQDEIDQVSVICSSLYGESYLRRESIVKDDHTWTHLKKVKGRSSLTLCRRTAVPDEEIDFMEFISIFGNAPPEEDIDGVPDNLL